MKKKIALGVIVIIIIIAVITVIKVKDINNNLAALNDLIIAEVDLSEIEDGVYYGSYTVLPVSAEVKVTVNNHIITEVEIIKHMNGQGKGAEALAEKVVEEQTLQLDVISGATYSSKVILKAIENALKSEPSN